MMIGGVVAVGVARVDEEVVPLINRRAITNKPQTYNDYDRPASILLKVRLARLILSHLDRRSIIV